MKALTDADKYEIRKAKIVKQIEKQTRYLDHKGRFKTAAERRMATWKRLGIVVASPRDTRHFDQYGRLVDVPTE